MNTDFNTIILLVISVQLALSTTTETGKKGQNPVLAGASFPARTFFASGANHPCR